MRDFGFRYGVGRALLVSPGEGDGFPTEQLLKVLGLAFEFWGLAEGQQATHEKHDREPDTLKPKTGNPKPWALVLLGRRGKSLDIATNHCRPWNPFTTPFEFLVFQLPFKKAVFENLSSCIKAPFQHRGKS